MISEFLNAETAVIFVWLWNALPEDQGAENQDPYTKGSWLHIQTDGQGPSGC